MLKRLVSRLVHALKSNKMLEAISSSEVAASQTTGDNVKKRPSENEVVSDVPSKVPKKDGHHPTGRADRKRKVALLMAYSGEGYYGIQVNSVFPTIESELFKALVSVGLVPQDHVDCLHKMSFQRAARTDKGVSAIGQVVSLKMLLNVDNLIGRINESLPKQIRILGLKRTTNSFNSKNHCSHRTYIYIMPTYALAPIEQNVVQDYRIDEDRINQLNDVLSKFKGTHKFHNFTSGRKYSDPSATRYIMEFKAGKPIIQDGVEFVTITIQGQSFMMHHIRKMVGLAIAIVRGFCGLDVIELSWKADKVDIPKAPGLGLVLEKLHYNGYNKRFGNDGIHDPLVWDEYQEQMDKFKVEFILKNIVQKEKEEKSMMNWMVTLHNHTFSYVDEDGERTRTGCCEASQNLKGRRRKRQNSDSSDVDISDNEIPNTASKEDPKAKPCIEKETSSSEAAPNQSDTTDVQEESIDKQEDNVKPDIHQTKPVSTIAEENSSENTTEKIKASQQL